MELNKIYCGDCRNMPEIDDNSVHLLVTSIPYYVGKEYESYLETISDYYQMLYAAFKEAVRVMIPGGKICINAGDIVTGARFNGGFPEEILTLPKIVDYMRIIDTYLYARIIWEKDDPWQNSSHVSFHSKVQHGEYRILPAHENLYVFRKGKEYRHDKSYFDGRFITKDEWKKLVHGVWKIRSVQANNYHSAMFPEELVSNCIKLYSFPGDTVLDNFMGCYDSKTQVLSKKGWKYFSEVTLQDELIVRSNDTIKYEHPLNIYEYDYSGDMVHIENMHKNLLVTPNHNMYVKTHADACANRPARFIQAADLVQHIYKIPCAGAYRWEFEDLSPEFMYLIGMYVSEGFFQKERDKRISNLIIVQNPGINYDTIMEKLQVFHPRRRAANKIILPLNKNQRDFIFNNCGTTKYNKFLSGYILNQRYLVNLFEAMMLGDGHTSKRTGQMEYYTVSEKLRDSFQELCLKLGFESSFSSRIRGGNLKDGRLIKATTPCYRIGIRRSKHSIINTYKDIHKEYYNGKVYCAEVPSHVLFVRREGKVSWCGNSGTTAVVAKKLGRNYLGYEKEMKYVELATNRLSAITEEMITPSVIYRDKTVNRELQEKLF